MDQHPAPTSRQDETGKRTVGKVRKAALQTTGAVFIGIGIPGLVIPFIQGIFFIAIGLALLTTYNERVNKLVHTRIERFGKFQKLVHKAEHTIVRLFGNP